MDYEILNVKSMAKNLNNMTYTLYYYKLSAIAMSVFKWNNLPNNIDERWIEKYLFHNGECMIFNDDMFGLMVSKVNRNGINHYDEPTDLYPVATNYSNTKSYINGVECVLIKNNDYSFPTHIATQLYAYRLADITRTQDVNINAQKTPVLIKCSEKQRLTLRNVYSQYQGNEPVIYGDKSSDFQDIEVLKTDAPVIFDKLQLQKHQLMNEYLTMLGINNANMDKKERLVDDEVQANNDEVEFFLETMLKTRQRACEEINRIFGTNISVERRVEYKVPNDSEGSDGSEEEVA